MNDSLFCGYLQGIRNQDRSQADTYQTGGMVRRPKHDMQQTGRAVFQPELQIGEKVVPKEGQGEDKKIRPQNADSQHQCQAFLTQPCLGRPEIFQRKQQKGKQGQTGTGAACGEDGPCADGKKIMHARAQDIPEIVVVQGSGNAVRSKHGVVRCSRVANGCIYKLKTNIPILPEGVFIQATTQGERSSRDKAISNEQSSPTERDGGAAVPEKPGRATVPLCIQAEENDGCKRQQKK